MNDIGLETQSKPKLNVLKDKIEEKIRQEDEVKRRLGGDPDTDPRRFKIHNAVDKLKLESIDPLTGLQSKMSFENEELREISIADRDPSSLPLEGILMDIDDFGRFNKEFGNTTGDEVLRKVGSAIKSAIRSSDSAGRIGGEEFAAIARQTDKSPVSSEEKYDDTPLPAERIREKVQEIRLEINRQITISVGTTNYRKGEGIQEFKKRLETAQILAKKLGKNRVVEGISLKGRDVYKDWTNNRYYEVFRGEDDEIGEIKRIKIAA